MGTASWANGPPADSQAGRRVSPADTVTAALGLVGWACAGPLVATLLVGRTALFFPSVRWLVVTAACWALTGGVAWLTTPLHGRTPRRSLGQLVDLVAGAMPSLALLAIVAPVLPLLYIDDTSYHLATSGGAATGPTLVGYVVLLAVAGGACRRYTAASTGPQVRSAPSRPTVLPGSLPASSTRTTWEGSLPAGGERVPAAGAGRAAAVTPLLAVALMVGANYGVFNPLAVSAPVSAAAALVLAINLTLAFLAALVGVAAWSGPPIGALVVVVAGLAFAPWREALASGALAGGVLLLAASGLYQLTRRRDVVAGGLLGAAVALAPPALGTLPALALLGRWRAALAGAAVAVLVTLVTAFAPLTPTFSQGERETAATRLAEQETAAAADRWPPWPLTSDPRRLAQALGTTPHVGNAALGAWHARLFFG
ncbi:MAG: glycosyltransferase 87 family protein, partial [Chloroflexota bacterium]